MTANPRPRFIALAALVVVSGVGTPLMAQNIQSHDASRYVGERQIVEGTVTEVRREGKVVRLAFGPEPQSFTVALIFGLLRDVPPDIDRVYQGRMIRVEGKIRSFHGAPEMLIQDLSLVEFIDATPTPVAAPISEEELELREEVNRLNTRVDRIEQELKALQRK